MGGVRGRTPKGGRPVLDYVSMIITIVSIIVTIVGIYVTVKHEKK
jgi:hypothetical protein